ncbi:hypothetical protein [Streptomyces violaceusniger]|uniref:hypothetical protein n=1 Tax=Streptomyces violaceusniger TaxID=68280 RepID=UPI0031D9ABA9
MSNSMKKRTAHARKAYSGEVYEAALAGIPNDRTHGLDSCTPGQRKMNALLALGLFNRGEQGAPPAKWMLSTLTWYTITVSPRWNHLVFITDAPDNVTRYLVPHGDSTPRLPGMRLRAIHDYRTYALEHVPTGARLVVSSRSDGKTHGERESSHFDFRTLDDPLDPVEERQLADVPPMGDAAQTLLAGMAVRMSMTDPRGRWATGNWYWDPLRREDGRGRDDDSDPRRRLWGAGNEWEAQWTGLPYTEDVAAALTDPVIGISGARLTKSKQAYEVTLGDSILKIRV